MATKRKATGGKHLTAGTPIIIDGGGKKGKVRVKFPQGEWSHSGDTSISNNTGDSIKKLLVKAGTLEFELAVSSYDEIRIKFA